ncbi:uncharacterized protein JN550_007734 [Neoarthrinium moseri]|uniref:uncharacterized protein n=1 Tax=Neoarthrinium moseri TaxID=1658444 RepID=UPI001FDBA167|nr:uncharacterized protein JN550_007734 [Neoarthrinium moseri]KAI1866346.1 hypothetical protein JN550_007734 [Neoarthrinium moseri]
MALPLGAIQLAVVSFIASTLSITALGLRLWSRHILRQSLHFNDYMAIVAMVFTAGAVSVFLAAGFAAGLGVHLQDIMRTDPGLFALHLRLFVPAQLLWAAANTSVKFSILSLYTTIFPERRFQLICYGTMAISLAYLVSVIVEAFALCKPVQYSWDKSIQGGTCTGENLAYLVAGITNLVIDAFIVSLPMPKLFGLQMSLSKKVGVAGMFSLGALICVLSLLRVLWLWNWDLTDMTYTVTPGAIYSVLEPTLGVVNACLPVIRPSLQRIFGKGTLNWTKKDPDGSDASQTFGSRQRHTLTGGKDAKHGDFVRLADDISLSNIRAAPNHPRNLAERDAIRVNREWTVDHSLPGGRSDRI